GVGGEEPGRDEDHPGEEAGDECAQQRVRSARRAPGDERKRQERTERGESRTVQRCRRYAVADGEPQATSGGATGRVRQDSGGRNRCDLRHDLPFLPIEESALKKR